MKNVSQRLGAVALFVILVTISICGCATSARPLAITPRVALMPTADEITMQPRPGKPIGGIIPVDVSVANGTPEPYLIVPTQIFAVDGQGQRILAVPASEAIQEAGDANALTAGLTGAAKNAAVGAIAGALIGAAIGVAAGAIVGQPGAGAAYGAMMGGGVGAAEGGVLGGIQGQAAAHQDAASQISALSLPAGEANPNFSVNGYVFFPKGDYSAIQMNVLDEETHQSQTLTTNWAEGQTIASVPASNNSTAKNVEPPHATSISGIAQAQSIMPKPANSSTPIASPDAAEHSPSVQGNPRDDWEREEWEKL
jgi:hypothetical protein